MDDEDRDLFKTTDLSAVQSSSIANHLALLGTDNMEIFSSIRETYREEICRKRDFAKVSGYPEIFRWPFVFGAASPKQAALAIAFQVALFPFEAT
ncbi:MULTISPECIES: hypothetical protein [Eikenella]|uniref:hypothetical protein n=1 Tax=Eikenella TaxID=538 RepID=UPI0007DE69EC|nr:MULTISPECIES: hypothetical protein [Eikenella]OAM28891.1 hypothetical protein A7P94_02465 [Eikenella sp. NML01-A-086]OAM40986.1 hypothetical protein A7Q02_06510 [Eikenella sp. NML97-A-109]